MLRNVVVIAQAAQKRLARFSPQLRSQKIIAKGSCSGQAHSTSLDVATKRLWFRIATICGCKICDYDTCDLIANSAVQACDFKTAIANCDCHRVFQGVPLRGRQLYFTCPSASDPFFKAIIFIVIIIVNIIIVVVGFIGGQFFLVSWVPRRSTYIVNNNSCYRVCFKYLLS